MTGNRPRLQKRIRSSAAAATVWILALTGPAAAQHGAAASGPPRTYSTASVTAAEAAAWRADLKALAEGLERVHPEPYHRTPKARFDSAAAALNAAIPRLAAHEIVVGFARLLALVGDGHTSLPLYFAPGVDFHVLPYRLGIYDGVMYLEAADARYRDIVGGRVVAIGNVPAAEALARVAPLISRDNDNWIAAVAPNLLNRIEVLHALKMSVGLEAVELTVELDGHTRTARVLALREPQPRTFGLAYLARLTDDWVDARDASPAPVPLHQRRFDELYWWDYVPDRDLLYIKWDQVQNREHGPTALEVFREAMRFARERRPARTVIDIRNNTGGEGGLVPAVVREIVRTREIDETGKLYVVIGRRTFSAGQMLTSYLERFTNAILVGEPSSAFYNGYAGHEFVHLPNSGILFAVSPDYYQLGSFPGDARRQATPVLAAIPSFDDYRSNRDPALEAVLAHRPGAFADSVIAALVAGDTARAAALVRAFDAAPVNRFRPATAELNALGYRVLNAGDVERAIDVFELNVAVHPLYANGWDSLGEAYVHAGRREEAIGAFRRALEIDPELAPTREWLRRLGATR